MTDLYVPPHSIEAEQTVLGALLIANDAFDTVSDMLSGQDFYADQHRVTWTAIAELLNGGKSVDPVTLAARLEDCGLLDRAGGREYVSMLAINTPTARNVAQYARVVRDRSTLRQVASAAAQMQNLVANPAGRSAVELFEEAQGLLSALETRQSGEEVQPIARYLPAYADMVERRRGKRGIQGLSTGLHDLDYMTGGLKNGDLIVVAGRPSIGKSALAMQVAQHAAITGASVAVFTLEMSRDQLIERMVANLGGIPGNDLQTGNLDDTGWGRVSDAFRTLQDARLFVEDVSGLSVPQLRAKTRRIARKHGLGLVVVDYLGLMHGDGESRYAQVTEISRRMKLLARELNLPVVAVAQLNRQSQNRADRRPQMSDLRDSGSVEQDADVVILVHREDYYDERTPMAGVAEAIVAKQRMGRTGTVYLNFRGEYSRFESLPRGWKPPELAPKSRGVE